MKKLLLSKVGGNIMLMRVDIDTKIIEYTTNGTDWLQPLLAEATTSSAGLMSAGDKSKLDGMESGASSAAWSDITDKPNVLVQYNGTVSDAGVITLENSVAVSDIALGSIVKFTSANATQGIEAGDLYQKKLQSYTPDPAEYDDTILIVAGAGTSSYNGTYVLNESYGTSGYTRRWYKNDSSGAYVYGNAYNRWMMVNPNITESSGYFLNDVTDPWSGTWAHDYGGNQYGADPAPTLGRATLNDATDRLALFTPIGKEATTNAAGLLSASGKTKLDGLSTVATSGSYADLIGKPIDLSSYGAAYDGHYTRFSYSSGGLDEYAMWGLHFDDSATDAVGHLSAPTITGTAAYTAARFANGFSFDGSTTITYPYNSSYFDFTSAQKVTFEFVIKTTQNTGESFIYSFAGGEGASYPGGSGSRFIFRLYNGTLMFRTYNGSWNDFSFGAVADGNLHHCAMVYDGNSTIKTYLDGALITTGTFALSSTGTYGGVDPAAFGSSFIGVLDEVRMTLGTERYTTEFTPPVVPFSTGVTRALYVDSVALSNATTSTAGLMSASDKNTLDGLATVATSGLYSDLSGAPTLAAVATSGSYSDLSGTPTLATVATSGSYADLTNKPSEATTSAAGFMSSSDKTKLDALFTSVTINSQTASYTLVLSDKSKLVTMSNASANTLTIPLSSSVAFPVGTWIDVSNIGSGTCTITAASGVTFSGTDGGTKDLAQWAGTRLYKIAENAWITR